MISLQNLWNLINKEGINSQTFQVWIFYHLHHGHTPDANFDEKQRAIYAAHIYFLLLTQPGMISNHLITIVSRCFELNEKLILMLLQASLAYLRIFSNKQSS